MKHCSLPPEGAQSTVRGGPSPLTVLLRPCVLPVRPSSRWRSPPRRRTRVCSTTRRRARRIAATQARLDGLSKTLDARLATLEQQRKQLGFDLLRDLEGIKSDIAKIRGQIEVLTYELNEAAEAPARPVRRPRFAAAQDGDGRAARAPHRRLRPTQRAAAAPRWRTRRRRARRRLRRSRLPWCRCRGAEQQAYDAALDQFKRGDYDGAIASSRISSRRIRAASLASSGAILDRQRAIRAQGLQAPRSPRSAR